MDDPSLATVRSLYGFNWAAVEGREQGLGSLEQAVGAEFEAHLSPETGGRMVTTVDDLRQFGYALEEDFAELVYDAEEVRELPDERILVLGKIHGRGRQSGLPLEAEFGHVWTFVDSLPRAIRAFLNHAQALQAASGGPDGQS